MDDYAIAVRICSGDVDPFLKSMHAFRHLASKITNQLRFRDEDFTAHAERIELLAIAVADVGFDIGGDRIAELSASMDTDKAEWEFIGVIGGDCKDAPRHLKRLAELRQPLVRYMREARIGVGNKFYTVEMPLRPHFDDDKLRVGVEAAIERYFIGIVEQLTECAHVAETGGNPAWAETDEQRQADADWWREVETEVRREFVVAAAKAKQELMFAAVGVNWSETGPVLKPKTPGIGKTHTSEDSGERKTRLQKLQAYAAQAEHGWRSVKDIAGAADIDPNGLTKLFNENGITPKGQTARLKQLARKNGRVHEYYVPTAVSTLVDAMTRSTNS